MTVTADVIALRAHLVAEAARKRSRAVVAQRWAATHWQTGYAYAHAEEARRCTDAWLAADARLRALDGLLAASKAQAEERPWHEHRSWPPTRAT